MSIELMHYLETDYKTILDHPAMTSEMKVGYLMAVTQIDHAAPRCSLSLKALGQAMRNFVSNYAAVNY